MDKREALLAAADFIEANPERYCFMSWGTPGYPDNRDDCCCMWGWTGHFLGMTGATNVDVAQEITGKEGAYSILPLYELTKGLDARSGAQALRAFAKKLFPEPTLDPAFVSFRRVLKEDSNVEA